MRGQSRLRLLQSPGPGSPAALPPGASPATSPAMVQVLVSDSPSPCPGTGGNTRTYPRGRHGGGVVRLTCSEQLPTQNESVCAGSLCCGFKNDSY